MQKYELEDFHRNISSEDFIADLRKVSTLLKKTSLSQKEYDNIGKYHSSTIGRHFGTWANALLTAGLAVRKLHNISEEDLINDLKFVAAKLGKKEITRDSYLAHGKYSINPFLNKFGSWFNALDKANLNKTRNLFISNEDLFENMEDVWEKLGRQPHYNDMQKGISKYSNGTYENRFGTWRKALEAFVTYVNTDYIKQAPSLQQPELIATDSAATNVRHSTKRNINWRLRFTIMHRDGFKCKLCGRSPATDSTIVLHVDHILPWAKGGETVPENLQTLCSICNIGKSDIDIG